MLQFISAFFSSSLNVALFLLAIVGLLLLVYGAILRTAAKRRTILHKGNKASIVGALDLILNKIPFIVAKEARLDKKISVLDVSYTARTITKMEVTAAFVGLLVVFHLQNLMVLIPILIVCINIPHSFVEMKITKKIKLFNDQVLDAFQLFVTEYTTTKSVKTSIVNICPRLKYPLRKEFERLGRKLNSGENVDECFLDFASRTQNKWTMIFAQMMMTFFRNGGEFTEQLMTITKSITDEKILAEQNTTELSSMRLMNYAMNVLVPLAYVANRIISPENSRIFVETPTGKIIIFGVSIACLISLYLGKKISNS